MDITMDQANVSVIQEMLHRLLNLPAANHLLIEKVFSEKHNNSEMVHFSVAWPTGFDFPAQWVLKTIPNASREPLFYQGVQGSCSSLPVAYCLGSESNSTSGQSHILLEDLTLSHSDVSDWPMPPPCRAGFTLVEALSDLHAAFWTIPALNNQAIPLPDFLQGQDAYQAYIGWLKRDFEIYAAGMGNCLDSSQSQIYPEIINLLPGLWETFWKPRLSNGPLPLIHGDLNPRNILYPNHSSGKVILVDWEAYRRGLPAHDLSLLLGLHLCPEFEDALPLLQRYHQNLVSRGICDYSFDDLLSDYEISLLYELFSPLKLYAQKGIQDECMIQNSIQALNSIREARF